METPQVPAPVEAAEISAQPYFKLAAEVSVRLMNGLHRIIVRTKVVWNNSAYGYVNDPENYAKAVKRSHTDSLWTSKYYGYGDYDPNIKFTKAELAYRVNETVGRTGYESAYSEGGIKGVIVRGLSPDAPLLRTVEMDGWEAVFDLRTELVDIGPIKTGDPLHAFKSKLWPTHYLKNTLVFSYGDKDSVVAYLKAVADENKILAEWQQTAIDAEDIQWGTKIVRLPEQPMLGNIADYADVPHPERAYKPEFTLENELKTNRLVAKLEKLLLGADDPAPEPEYEDIHAKFIVTRRGHVRLREIPREAAGPQAADNTALDQLSKHPFDGGTQSEPLVLAQGGAAPEEHAAGGLSKPSKTTVKPPLPEGLKETTPAAGKLKNAAMEYGPDALNAAFAGLGAYFVEKRMKAYSDEAASSDNKERTYAIRGKAVGLGAGYTAAVMSQVPVAYACAPAAAGAWTYFGCVLLGTMGISETVTQGAGQFAAWYLKNEKKYQTPIPKNVKENIKHPIAAIRQAFRE
ncbi:MAG: hypothetical protein WC204_07525 [Elusimicrobiales bacterium]